MKQDTTHLWRLYENGKDYNRRISPDIYSTIDENERFYSGDQWNGVSSGNLDTPVFNIFKRSINYFIAAIMSQQTKMQFVPELVGDEPQNEEEQSIADAAELISAYSETLWEKLKMNNQIRDRLLDAALSGDACQYMWWNSNIDTMQEIMGDIDAEGIDNVNVFFGNPNDKRVNHNGIPVQPYIVIAFRQMVSKLRAEAEANGVSKDDIELITSDVDNLEQSGDRGKIELDGNKDETGKAIALLKLFYDEKTKTVKAVKSTKFVDIRPEWDTMLSQYPVGWMNWDSRKNSYHGQAVGTGLVDNQIFINKAFAMLMLWIRMNAIGGKVLYDKNRIETWSNQIGAAIGVDGDTLNAVYNVQPGQISEVAIKIIDLAIQYTKDFIGASDGALGEINPEQASGVSIIATQKQASIPLENIKSNLYQFIEDIGYVWLDMMATYYGLRKVAVSIMGKRVVKEFDFSLLKKMKLRIKVDVGPSSYWSELTAVQTLDNLRKDGVLTVTQYLERLPNGYLPQKQELIEELKAQDTEKNFVYEMMAQYVESLPPEIRMQLDQLMQSNPEEYEKQVQAMMMGGGQGGQVQAQNAQIS